VRCGGALVPACTRHAQPSLARGPSPASVSARVFDPVSRVWTDGP
jgi:hypothetical protein